MWISPQRTHPNCWHFLQLWMVCWLQVLMMWILELLEQWIVLHTYVCAEESPSEHWQLILLLYSVVFPCLHQHYLESEHDDGLPKYQTISENLSAKSHYPTYVLLRGTLGVAQHRITAQKFGKYLNVQFQKISIPTPWKVNGNSRGWGVSKAKILKGKYGA